MHRIVSTLCIVDLTKVEGTSCEHFNDCQVTLLRCFILCWGPDKWNSSSYQQPALE